MYDLYLYAGRRAREVDTGPLVRGDEKFGGNKSIRYAYIRETEGGGSKEIETQGEETRGRREQMREDAHELVCKSIISTEINQGCTQISKRKITKINRPDVQRDKKHSVVLFFHFSFLSRPLFVLSLRLPAPPEGLLQTRPWTRNDRVYDRTRGVYINYTDRDHKISINKPGTSLIAPHAPLNLRIRTGRRS